MSFEEPGQTRASGLAPVVMGLIALIVAAHLAMMVASPRAATWALYHFALIPLRFEPGSGYGFTGLLEPLAPIFGHAFLHSGLIHLALNMLFLMAAGSVTARHLGESRRGGLRFLALFFASVAGGALTYLAINPGSEIPVVGASGGVCGVLAGLFMGARGHWRDSLSDPQVRTGLGVIIGLNVLAPALIGPALGVGIAWEAHLGGFIGGMVAFPALSPHRSRNRQRTPFD